LLRDHGDEQAQDFGKYLNTLIEVFFAENVTGFEVPVAGFPGGAQSVLIKKGAIFATDTRFVFRSCSFLFSFKSL